MVSLLHRATINNDDDGNDDGDDDDRVAGLTYNVLSLDRPRDVSLWPPYEIGGPLYFCPVVTIFLSFYLFLFLA